MPVRRNAAPAGEAREPRGSKVYQMVTQAIIQRMMKGDIPWRKTSTVKGTPDKFVNWKTGKPYSLINGLLLEVPGQYATWNQIEDAGGHVRKGAKAKFVLYWGEYIPKDKKEEAKRLEEEGKDISHLKVRFPKYYNVFNVESDTEGLELRKAEEPAKTVASQDPTDIADMVVRDYTVNTGVTVKKDRTCPEASYDAVTDTVEMPEKDNFTYEEDFYATLMQQFVHSTASEDRCARKREYERIKEDNMTVREELIAEIGSSMILAVAGMRRPETHEQIAAECQRWINAMNRDFRLIVNATSGAEKAAKYILGEFAA